MLVEFSHKSMDQPVPAIPWNEISKNPDRYIDQAVFNVPVRIRDPKEYMDECKASLAGYATPPSPWG